MRQAFAKRGAVSGKDVTQIELGADRCRKESFFRPEVPVDEGGVRARPRRDLEPDREGGRGTVALITGATRLSSSSVRLKGTISSRHRTRGR